MWNYIILVVLIIGIIFIYINKQCELFVDSYNATLSYSNSEYHDTIVGEIKSKYERAFNYELENVAYRTALEKSFNMTKVCINPVEWSVVEPVNRTIPLNVQNAYSKALDHITRVVTKSPYMVLPDGKSPKIQIVHDVLVSYQINRREPSYIMTLQLVMYRESKFHGKDVGMMVKVDKNVVTILDIWINGVIFEDKIALFPVLPTDPYNTNVNMSAADFNDQNSTTYVKKGYEFCVTKEVLTKKDQDKCINAIIFPELKVVK